MHDSSALNHKELTIFGWVGLAWLIVSQIFCCILGNESSFFGGAAQWLFVLWLISMANLIVLSQLIKVILTLLVDHEKKLVYTIQAFCWGTFKVICVGLFIGVLLKGYLIPTRSLLMGVGTFVVVPLLGGLLWSQRMLQHA